MGQERSLFVDNVQIRIGSGQGDYDMTAAQIRTCDGMLIADAYGQNPAFSTVSHEEAPDLGTLIPPFRPPLVEVGTIGKYVWLDEEGDCDQDPEERSVWRAWGSSWYTSPMETASSFLDGNAVAEVDDGTLDACGRWSSTGGGGDPDLGDHDLPPSEGGGDDGVTGKKPDEVVSGVLNATVGEQTVEDSGDPAGWDDASSDTTVDFGFTSQATAIGLREFRAQPPSLVDWLIAWLRSMLEYQGRRVRREANIDSLPASASLMMPEGAKHREDDP